MIISASRRTDIPALYAEWFFRRIDAGYCLVANPRNAQQVTRVSLTPETVEAIVFWTKQVGPMLPRLAELEQRGFRYYFTHTITGYPPAIEPGTPPLAEVLANARRLVDHHGAGRLIWRYDPIVLSTLTPPDAHMARFTTIAQTLQGYTTRVVISLLDDYRAARRRLQALAHDGVQVETASPHGEAVAGLLRGMAACAGAAGMEICSCAEADDLTPYGITPGRCIDADWLRRVFGIELEAKKDSGQRPACGCVASQDIGAYDTCTLGCRYCYATRLGPEARAAHDPDAPLLQRAVPGRPDTAR